VLINLAETETFDIIGDIAIEGLGTLKDPSAVPVLQRIVGDASRDKTSRELARKALAKLGAPEAGGRTGNGSTTGDGGQATGGGGVSGTAGGGVSGSTGGATSTGGGAKTSGGATGSSGGGDAGSSGEARVDVATREDDRGGESTGLEGGGGGGLIGDSGATGE